MAWILHGDRAQENPAGLEPILREILTEVQMIRSGLSGARGEAV